MEQSIKESNILSVEDSQILFGLYLTEKHRKPIDIASRIAGCNEVDIASITEEIQVARKKQIPDLTKRELQILTEYSVLELQDNYKTNPKG